MRWIAVLVTMVALAMPAGAQTVTTVEVPDDDPAWLGWLPTAVAGGGALGLAVTGNFDKYVDQPFDRLERKICGYCGSSDPLSWVWHGLISVSLSSGAALITWNEEAYTAAAAGVATGYVIREINALSEGGDLGDGVGDVSLSILNFTVGVSWFGFPGHGQ